MARKKTLKVWRQAPEDLVWTWGDVYLKEEMYLGEVVNETIDIDGTEMWCDLPPHVAKLLDWLDCIPTEPYYLEIE